MTHRLAVRLALGWQALIALQLGFWALFAPQGFFDDFPGFGRSWVAVDGPFNEHLIRDVGALNLALASLLIYAVIRATSELASIAAIASLVWGVPHFVYHLFNTEGLSAFDNALSLGGLALSVVFAAWILVAARKLDGPVETVAGVAHG